MKRVLEFNKEYYVVGYTQFNSVAERGELKQKYPNLERPFSITHKIKSNNYDAIVEGKGKGYQSLVKYKYDEFGDLVGVESSVESYSLWETEKDAQDHCDMLNSQLEDVMSKKY